jgi:crotonobetaine/carnitine-CoA ligase
MEDWFAAPELTIGEMLEARANETPEHVFGIYQNERITCSTLRDRVNQLAGGLSDLGVSPGSRVAVMLANHPDHITTFLALATLGAVWVPINVNLRGASLGHIVKASAPDAVIVDAEYLGQLQPLLEDRRIAPIIVRGPSSSIGFVDFSAVDRSHISPPPTPAAMDDTRAVFFTSGTTGPPKGAFVTERMLRTCAIGAGTAADVRAADVFLLWEPIYHTSGAQMVVLALMKPVTLAVVRRFSASQFWDQVRTYGVTKMHYLGGVLDILLKQPPQTDDRRHGVRIAFGAGCTVQSWRAFQERFGIEIREVYGLTEGSCFTTLNTSGKIGSIGKPYPYLDVKIIDGRGNPVPVGTAGEIVMRGRQAGLIMKGYLEDPEATAAAVKEGWLHTGDLGRCDADGDFYYVGRRKDSVRRRGENVSAWEVERVLNSHPDIQESAVIGIDAEVGEQDIKAFVLCRPGIAPDPLALIKWCEPRMPYFQIPRFITFVEAFEKTPTERIRKEVLSKTTQDCWDLERSGYRLHRR